MASPLASIDNNTMGDSITLTKQNNTILTLSTKEKYTSKNIELTLSVRGISGTLGGSASAGKATAAISNVNSMATITTLTGLTAGTDYWTVKATATSTAGSYTPKYTVNTSGWLNSTVSGSAQTVSVTADSTGKSIYIPKASMTIGGTNTVSPTASVAGTTNVVYMNTTNNGIAVTATGGGTASVTATATTNQAGYAPASTQLGSKALNASSKTTTATQYIYKIAVPKDKPFQLEMTADTALDSTSDLTLTNNAFRRIIGTNAGVLYARHNISEKGTLYVRAYNETSDQTIIADGAWVTTAVSGAGTFYGKVTVSAGTITNNTSGGTSSGTINRGKQIKIGKGFYASDAYYTAQSNSGTISITASGNTNVDGYATASVAASTITNNTTLASGASSSGTINRGKYIKIGKGFVNNDTYYVAQANSGTLSITTSHNAQTNVSCDGYANVNASGINVPNSKTFQVKVPNGTGTITFNFSVDANGNVLVT